MNIIIPLAGKGERFSREGYTVPKPLVPIADKCIINHVIDNLLVYDQECNHSYFVFYNDAETTAHISRNYPHIRLIHVGETRGAAETLYRGLSLTGAYDKTLVVDCDTVYTVDIASMFYALDHENAVFYTHDETPDPIYSYIAVNDVGTITEIREKVKISDNANTGAYAFTDARVLRQYCKGVLDESGELFTSRVIGNMMNDGHVFKAVELPTHAVISMGIPSAVRNYETRCQYFMFDLDGTLVITDDLYVEVWTQLLSRYGLVLSREMYATYIQGNADNYVVKQLALDVDVSEISGEKDRLFLLHMRDKVQSVSGAAEFIRTVHECGHRICVVTNCNRPVAAALVEWLNIAPFVDFIVANGDSKMAKPSGDPYLLAMSKYRAQPTQCIIFEDSKTGLLSAKHASPKLIVGLTTLYEMPEADMTIANYTDIDPKLFTDYSITECTVRKMICTEPSARIVIDSQKLKGGFIADVISYTVIAENGRESHRVLKYENEHETGLTVMAKQLRLYEREYWFYANVADKLDGIVHVPKFSNFVYDDSRKTRGICLENMNKIGRGSRFRLNLDLNREPVEVSLKIVDRMAKLHASFWGKTDELLGYNTAEFSVYTSTDEPFCPFIGSFIRERTAKFRDKWYKFFGREQCVAFDSAIAEFDEIQRRMGEGAHLTFIHGDIKSPNIFYDSENDNEPWFLDWQHCAIAKGVQDLVFFIIESFRSGESWPLFKAHYYAKLIEYGVVDYTVEQYNADIADAIRYVPLFTAVWFGTVPQDELIDKDFPYQFIMKLACII